MGLSTHHIKLAYDISVGILVEHKKLVLAPRHISPHLRRLLSLFKPLLVYQLAPLLKH